MSTWKIFGLHGKNILKRLCDVHKSSAHVFTVHHSCLCAHTVVVLDQTWKDHVCNCMLCHPSHVYGQINLLLVVLFIRLHCMLCGWSIGATIMLICDRCSKNQHMGCFVPPLGEVLVRHGFAFNTLSRSKCLFLYLDNRDYLKFFSIVICISLRIWGIIIKWLTMKFTFAPNLLIIFSSWNQNVHFWGDFTQGISYFVIWFS